MWNEFKFTSGWWGVYASLAYHPSELEYVMLSYVVYRFSTKKNKKKEYIPIFSYSMCIRISFQWHIFY